MNKDKLSELHYDDYLNGTKQRLDENAAEKQPYNAKVCGKDFIVLPNVFSPKYFLDTELFAQNFPSVVGEEVLEIGPGTGAIAIMLALGGAKKVVAVDVNPDAVKNTQENINLHNVGDKVEVRHADLYDGLKAEEKFDTIFWNTPFGLVENENLSDLEKSVYDSGYKSTEKFIKESKKYLKPGGRLLIGFSSTLGRLDMIEKFVKDADMEMKLIYETNSEEVYPVKFEIFEATVI